MPEVAEPAGRVIEGLVQEAHAAPCTRRDRVPTELPLVQQIDLQGASDVVCAVAVGWIRVGAYGVLHDPHVVSESVEMLPDHGIEGRQIRH